jgi:hypothetical protein
MLSLDRRQKDAMPFKRAFIIEAVGFASVVLGVALLVVQFSVW